MDEPLVTVPSKMAALLRPEESGTGPHDVLTFRLARDGMAPYEILVACSGPGWVTVAYDQTTLKRQPCDLVPNGYQLALEAGTHRVRLIPSSLRIAWRLAVLERT